MWLAAVFLVLLVLVAVRWLSLGDGRWLLVGGAGLSMLLVGDVLVAVRVELTGGDVEEAMADEPESELLTGEAEEVELVIEVDLAAVDERWLSLIEVDLAAVDERWLGLEGGRWLLEEGGLSMVLVAVRVERLTGGDDNEAMVGEAESELLTGETEEMELVIEVGLVAVDERWLGLGDGR